jgi:tetratricopeptide (TPR) repeat protein
MSTDQHHPQTAESIEVQRWFVPALLCICVAGLVLRALALAEFLDKNPIAEAPVVDGWVYWQWAGRIAEGRLMGRTPFLSAPLYPYLLGLLRSAGFGLVGVYLLQLILHLVTAWLIGCIARRRFNAHAGIAAAALFLLLADTAFDSTRILASTVQVLLASLLWWQLLRAVQRPAPRAWAAAGGLLGLFCLAYPAAMILIAVLGTWIYRCDDQRRRGALSTAALVGAATLVIAPATWHNWRASGGEFIPITAHSGITLLQGNSPEANGVYQAVPGISSSREFMHYDAAAKYQQATGKPGSWREIDRFYRQQALAFWRTQPTRALALICKRIYLFATARYYNEIHWPATEASRGFGHLQKLAPVPTPWLMGLAVWGLISTRSDPRNRVPEWALFLLPLLVVALFFYSPRYRMVCLPVVVVIAAWTLVSTVTLSPNRKLDRSKRRRMAVVVALVLAGTLTGPVNRVLNIDHPAHDNGGFDFNLGVALARLGQPDRALAHLRRALEINPALFEARINLANALAATGDLTQAEREFHIVLQEQPYCWPARLGLAEVLTRQNKSDQAIALYEELLRDHPTIPTAHYKLGLLLEAGGNVSRACRCLSRAVELAPEVDEFRRALGNLCPDSDRE